MHECVTAVILVWCKWNKMKRKEYTFKCNIFAMSKIHEVVDVSHWCVCVVWRRSFRYAAGNSEMNAKNEHDNFLCCFCLLCTHSKLQVYLSRLWKIVNQRRCVCNCLCIVITYIFIVMVRESGWAEINKERILQLPLDEMCVW